MGLNAEVAVVLIVIVLALSGGGPVPRTPPTYLQGPQLWELICDPVPQNWPRVGHRALGHTDDGETTYYKARGHCHGA